MRGRVPVGYAASGGHTDVSTLGNNDGVAEAFRRPKHRHTPHSHTTSGSDGAHTHATNPANTGSASNHIFMSNRNVSGSNWTDNGSLVGVDGLHGHTLSSVDGGSGNTNDSLDAPAWLVLNCIIKT